MIAQEKLPGENEEVRGRNNFPTSTGLFMNTKRRDGTFSFLGVNFLREQVEICCGRKMLRSWRVPCLPVYF
jgi:hypothetical protein